MDSGRPQGRERRAQRRIVTPSGDLLAVAGPDGVLSFSFAEPARMDRHRSPESEDGASAGHLDELATQMERYRSGALREFTVPVDYASAGVPPGFARDVYEAIREIPFGHTAAYGEIAVDAGRPGAARAVGTLCRDTPWVFLVPVHRVRRADGGFGEGGAARKALAAWEAGFVGIADRPF